MVTCTNSTRTTPAYVTPEIWMKAWMTTVAVLAVSMFLVWSVIGAVTAAFFGVTADNLQALLYLCGAAVSISSLGNIAVDWFLVRSRRGRLRIVEEATGRVVVVAPHQIAAALAPWYAGSAQPDVVAERLNRLQTWYMAGQPGRHLEAVMGLSINPVRKSV